MRRATGPLAAAAARLKRSSKVREKVAANGNQGREPHEAWSAV
jgi:hypothetical protein